MAIAIKAKSIQFLSSIIFHKWNSCFLMKFNYHIFDKIFYMTLRAQLIQEIISKIDQIPDAKLKKLLVYIESDENFSEEKNSILGFAGTWGDIDKATINDLTTKLHKNRNKNNRSIN